jgi:cytochrome P450
MAPAADFVSLESAELPFLDVLSREYSQDPWALIGRLRTEDPRQGRLLRSDRGVELIAYEPVGEVMGDKRLETIHSREYWEDRGAGPLAMDFLDSGHLLTFEPEHHLRVRRLMVKAFQASRIESQRAFFHELAHRLVDGFVDRCECDLVLDFTHRYSIELLCRLIGVPVEDIPQFEQATLDMVLLNAYPLEPVADQLEAALQRLWDYSAALVERRRTDPRQDFVTSLLPAFDEGKLSESEMIWGIANLLFAGHDTTRYQLASIARALIETGEWEATAASPERCPAIVEEGLRFWVVTPVQSRMVAVDDYVLDGVHLPRGTVLRINMFATTRDPDFFSHPHEFTIDAEHGKTVPFGQGVHKCVGHTLARIDMEIGVEVLTRRLTDVRIDGQVRFQPTTGSLWGPTSLPIAFSAR